MAVRQYIGARYVPRFIGTYDPTQIYEALDVVDNGSGTSYIARQNVPAGTPLTDTEYWFVYGASSGAIISLQNRMDAAENDINDMDPKVTELYAMNNSIFRGKKIVAYGDSLMNQGGGAVTYLTYLKDYSGAASVVNRAVPSTGIDIGGSNSGISLINASTDLTSFDIILIGYGTNEWQNAKSIYQMYNDIYALINAIKSKNPAISIIWCLPPVSFRDFGSGYNNMNSQGLTLENYVDIIADALDRYKIPVVDFFHHSTCNDNNVTTKMLSSGGIYVHPTAAFAAELATILTNGTTAKSCKRKYISVLTAADFIANGYQVTATEFNAGDHSSGYYYIIGSSATAQSTKKTLRETFGYVFKGKTTTRIQIKYGTWSSAVINPGMFKIDAPVNAIPSQGYIPIEIENLDATACNLTAFDVLAYSVVDVPDNSQLDNWNRYLLNKTSADVTANQYVRSSSRMEGDKLIITTGAVTANANIAALTPIWTLPFGIYENDYINGHILRNGNHIPATFILQNNTIACIEALQANDQVIIHAAVVGVQPNWKMSMSW